jgi:hypothetical protein
MTAVFYGSMGLACVCQEAPADPASRGHEITAAVGSLPLGVGSRLDGEGVGSRPAGPEPTAGQHLSMPAAAPSRRPDGACEPFSLSEHLAEEDIDRRTHLPAAAGRRRMAVAAGLQQSAAAMVSGTGSAADVARWGRITLALACSALPRDVCGPRVLPGHASHGGACLKICTAVLQRM